MTCTDTCVSDFKSTLDQTKASPCLRNMYGSLIKSGADGLNYAVITAVHIFLGGEGMLCT